MKTITGKELMKKIKLRQREEIPYAIYRTKPASHLNRLYKIIFEEIKGKILVDDAEIREKRRRWKNNKVEVAQGYVIALEEILGMNQLKITVIAVEATKDT